MQDINIIIKELSDTQLQDTINEFEFIKTCCITKQVEKICDSLINNLIKELRRRTEVEEIYPVEEILDNRDFVD